MTTSKQIDPTGQLFNTMRAAEDASKFLMAVREYCELCVSLNHGGQNAQAGWKMTADALLKLRQQILAETGKR